MLWKIVADRPARTVAAAVGPCAPREIEIRLRSLIRGYVQQRSTAVAVAVARHIEALCAHPDYRGSWEERCALRRLAWHWNGLAWLTADQPAPPFGGAANREGRRRLPTLAFTETPRT